MTRRRRIGLITAASILGLVALLLISAVIVVQTRWFADLVRQKVIAAAEDSTGGRAEIGSFEIDLRHLTVRMRNVVLHGTEPQGSDPLLRIRLLELRLKLLTGLKQAIDLRYLGIEQPQLNLIVLPDGRTNIPQPKTPSVPSQTSGLQTVVDLAVNRFELNHGSLRALDRESAFSGQGDNLRALLNYDATGSSYTGNVAIDPVIVSSGRRPPLNLHLNVPLVLEGDAIRVNGATLAAGQSHIELSASVENMKNPLIKAHANAALSLAELQRSFDLGMDPSAKGAPNRLTAELAANIDGKTNAISIQTAHLVLGHTTLAAAGNLDTSSQAGAHFDANLALDELSRLFKVTSVQPAGDLVASGRLTLDKNQNYAANGMLSSRAVSIRSGASLLSDVKLSTPFHADPYLVSLDGLRLETLGGSLDAKIFLVKSSDLSVEGRLSNLSIPRLVTVLTGKDPGYDGAVNGSLLARANLKSKGTSGYSARTALTIAPGFRGVPVSGAINARYVGASGALDLGQSYITLPNTRLDLSGSINRRIDVKLASSNLNDFLPAFNFGSAHPQTSLPVVLQGGQALLSAAISGKTVAPQISGHAEITDFAVEQHAFTRLAMDVAASPLSAAVQNGVLIGKGLNTSFDGSAGLVDWTPQPSSPVTANLSLRNGDLSDLAGLAGETSLEAHGATTADIHIHGTYGNPLGTARLAILNGGIYGQPFSRMTADVDLADQLITLSQLELEAAGGNVKANGRFLHPRQSFTTGHAELQLAANGIQLANVEALSKQNAGVAGLLQLTTTAAADLQSANGQTAFKIANVNAEVAAHNLRVENQAAGDLTATVRTANNAMDYCLDSNFAGSAITVKGRTALNKEYSTTADASIKSLSIAKALQMAGQGSIPARGDFSATAHVDGTLSAPVADVSFELASGNLYQEPIDGFTGKIHYSNRLVAIPGIELRVPAGSVTLSGSYQHALSDLQSGSLTLKLTSSSIALAKIEHIQEQKPDLTGTIRLAADLSATLRDEPGKNKMLVSNLNADASASNLQVRGKNFGGVSATARTAGQNLDFRLDSDFAQSQVHASGQAQLTGDYPARANLTFTNVKYSNLASFLATQTAIPPPFEALMEGQASVSGPILNPDDLTGRLQLDRLDVRTNASRSPTGAPALRVVELQNKGPVKIGLAHESIQIEQLHVGGRDTELNASGAINLKKASEPLALNVDANLNLGLLQDADRDFYSSGLVTLNTSIRGSFAQPRANGRIVLKNANVNYADAPNGLSNANGVILLNGTNASIESLSAESGGGKISLTGFFGLGAGVPSFNLRATASSVRVRYTGLSATSDATISLAGNLKRSLLTGNVVIQRIAYANSSDAGSILSAASTPPSTPSSPNPLLSGMRLDVHVSTDPDIQVVSTYANRLSVLANVRLRGTAENPGMLGRVTVTDGQLVFFGNTYTVTTGTINFYNPNEILPVLNVSLDTVTQGVNVTIGVTGQMNDLKLNYRSDPPLTFEQIVQLLATNTTPANPVIAAHQPAPPTQSMTQMGESAVLSQAVANPLASRVQRVFGLSQLKIDPSLSGATGPSARVTLQEKIASNITFTYITDVHQTNSQIVRVQWDISNSISAVGLRDYNGNVSVELLYRFTRR